MEWVQAFLAAIRLDEVAVAGVLTLAIVFVLTGRLVPKSTVDEIREERDGWKAAYLESEKARGILVAQVSELSEVGRMANHVLQSLPRVGGDDDTVAKS